MDIFLVIFFLLFIFLSWKRLDWAVMFLLFALPSYLIRFKILGIPFTLLEGMILIAFITWFIANLSGFRANLSQSRKLGIKGWFSKKKNRYPFDIEIVLLLVVSLIAVAVAGFNDSALGIWKAYFFEPVLLFILVVNVFKNRHTPPSPPLLRGGMEIQKILLPLAMSALVVSLVAIYQKITGVWIFNEFWADVENRRVVSFFGYPNAVGLFLSPLILLFVGWLFSKPLLNPPLSKGRKMWIIGFVSLTVVLSFLAIWFARSKGALIGVVAGLIIFGLLANKKLRWGILGLMLIGVIGISVCQPTRDFIYGKIVFNKSLQIRQAQWSETWKMLKDGRLITGSGLANYQAAITPYHIEGFFYNDGTDPEFHRHTVWNVEYRDKVWQPLEIYLYPHNLFLNFWTELGLAGLLLFGWIIGKYFWLGVWMARGCYANNANRRKSANCESANRYLILGLVGAMVVIVVHGLVDAPYFKNDLAMMFWVLAAMMGLVKITKKRE